MCEKLSSKQSESDQRFAELEEKRMKFKYDIMRCNKRSRKKRTREMKGKDARNTITS